MFLKAIYLVFLFAIQNLQADLVQNSNLCGTDQSYILIYDICVCNDPSYFIFRNNCIKKKMPNMTPGLTIPTSFTFTSDHTFLGWFKANSGDILFNKENFINVTMNLDSNNNLQLTLSIFQANQAIQQINIAVNQQNVWFFMRYSIEGQNVSFQYNDNVIQQTFSLSSSQQPSNLQNRVIISGQSAIEIALVYGIYNPIKVGNTYPYRFDVLVNQQSQPLSSYPDYQSYQSISNTLSTITQEFYYPLDIQYDLDILDYSVKKNTILQANNQITYSDSDFSFSLGQGQYLTHILDMSLESIDQNLNISYKSNVISNSLNSGLYNQIQFFVQDSEDLIKFTSQKLLTLDFFFKFQTDPTQITSCIILSIDSLVKIQFSNESGNQVFRIISFNGLNSGDYPLISGVSLFSQNTWYQVYIYMSRVSTNNKLIMYINGVSKISNGSYQIDPFSVSLGFNSTTLFTETLYKTKQQSTQYFEGQIAELRLFNIFVSPTSLKSKRITSQNPNLLLYLPLVGDNKSQALVSLSSNLQIYYYNIQQSNYQPDQQGLIFCNLIGRYFISQLSCGSCFTACQTCTSATQCSSCLKGYTLTTSGSTQQCVCNQPNVVSAKFSDLYTSVIIQFDGLMAINNSFQPFNDIVSNSQIDYYTVEFGLKNEFSMGSTTQFPINVINTLYCYVQNVYNLTFDDGLTVQPTIVYTITVQQNGDYYFNASQSTSGYPLKNILSYQFVIKNTDTNGSIILQSTDNSQSNFTLPKNQAVNLMYLQITVSNFKTSASVSQQFSECTDLAMNSAQFYNNYSQIQITFNQNIQLVQSIDTQYIKVKSVQNNIILLDLLQDFPFTIGSTFSILKSSLQLLYQCPINNNVQQTLTPDTVQAVQPTCQFSVSQTDSTVTFTLNNCYSSYPLQSSLTYQIQIFPQNSGSYVASTQTNVLTINKSLLQYDFPYQVDYQVGNFLSQFFSGTQPYTQTCIPKTVTGQWNIDYTKIQISWSENVTFDNSLSTTQVFFDPDFTTITVLNGQSPSIWNVLMIQNFVKQNSYTINPQIVSNQYCLFKTQIIVQINDYNTQLAPNIQYQVNLDSQNLNIDLSQSSSQYPIQPIMTVQFQFASGQNQISFTSNYLQFAIDRNNLVYNTVYTVNVSLTNFLQKVSTATFSYNYACVLVLQQGQFDATFTKLVFQFQQAIQLSVHTPIQNVDNNAILNSNSLTFNLLASYPYRVSQTFTLPDSYVKLQTEQCNVAAMDLLISDNGHTLKPTAKILVSNPDFTNNQMLFTNASQSGSLLQPQLAVQWSVFKNSILQTQATTNTYLWQGQVQSDQGNWSIQLQVTNFLNQQDTITYQWVYQIQVQKSPIIIGYLENGLYSRKSPILLSAQDNSAIGTTEQVTWVLLSTSALLFDFPISQVNGNTLTFNSFTIQGNAQFQIRAMYQMYQQNTLVAQILVDYEFGTKDDGLYCKIQGGDQIIIDQQPFIFDGSFSSDLNQFFNNVEHEQLTYTWSIGQNVLSETTSLLTLDGSEPQISNFNTNYTLKLQISTSYNSQTCYYQIDIQKLQYNAYTIRANINILLSSDSKTITPSLPIIFQAQILTQYPATVAYEWNIINQNIQGNLKKFCNKQGITGNSDRYFKLQAYSLQPNTYTIQLKVKDQISSQTVTLDFKVCSVPDQGSFQIIDNNTNVYQLKALNFQDADQKQTSTIYFNLSYPLKYIYYLNEILLFETYQSTDIINISGDKLVSIKLIVQNSLFAVSIPFSSNIQLRSPTQPLDYSQITDFNQKLRQIMVDSQYNLGSQSQTIMNNIVNEFSQQPLDKFIFFQTSQVIYNIVQNQCAQNISLDPTIISNVLQSLSNKLSRGLTNQQVNGNILQVTDQPTQQILQDTIENIAKTINAMFTTLLSPKSSLQQLTKTIINQLALSLQIYKVPSEDPTVIQQSQFNITSQTLEQLSFQSLQINNIKWPSQGLNLAQVTFYQTPEYVKYQNLKYVYIQWQQSPNQAKKFKELPGNDLNQNETLVSNAISLTLFDSQTLSEYPLTQMSEFVEYTYNLPNQNYSNFKCASMSNNDDYWLTNCQAKNPAPVQNSDQTFSVICQCNHLTDFGVFAEVYTQSNISTLYTNFKNTDWSNLKNIFNWIFFQQVIFFITVIVLYQAAKKIDLNFFRRCTNNQYQSPKNKILLLEAQNHKKKMEIQNGNEFQNQENNSSKNKLSNWKIIQLIFRKDLVWVTLKEDLTYISWICYPQKSFVSKNKFLLLMIKVQSLFFIVYLQMIQQIQGTVGGFIYSLLLSFIFYVLISIVYKQIIIQKVIKSDQQQISCQPKETSKSLGNLDRLKNFFFQGQIQQNHIIQKKNTKNKKLEMMQFSQNQQNLKSFNKNKIMIDNNKQEDGKDQKIKQNQKFNKIKFEDFQIKEKNECQLQNNSLIINDQQIIQNNEIHQQSQSQPNIEQNQKSLQINKQNKTYFTIKNLYQIDEEDNNDEQFEISFKESSQLQIQQIQTIGLNQISQIKQQKNNDLQGQLNKEQLESIKNNYQLNLTNQFDPNFQSKIITSKQNPSKTDQDYNLNSSEYCNNLDQSKISINNIQKKQSQQIIQNEQELLKYKKDHAYKMHSKDYCIDLDQSEISMTNIQKQQSQQIIQNEQQFIKDKIEHGYKMHSQDFCIDLDQSEISMTNIQKLEFQQKIQTEEYQQIKQQIDHKYKIHSQDFCIDLDQSEISMTNIKLEIEKNENKQWDELLDPSALDKNEIQINNFDEDADIQDSINTKNRVIIQQPQDSQLLNQIVNNTSKFKKLDSFIRSEQNISKSSSFQQQQIKDQEGKSQSLLNINKIDEIEKNINLMDNLKTQRKEVIEQPLIKKQQNGFSLMRMLQKIPQFLSDTKIKSNNQKNIFPTQPNIDQQNQNLNNLNIEDFDQNSHQADFYNQNPRNENEQNSEYEQQKNEMHLYDKQNGNLINKKQKKNLQISLNCSLQQQNVQNQLNLEEKQLKPQNKSSLNYYRFRLRNFRRFTQTSEFKALFIFTVYFIITDLLLLNYSKQVTEQTQQDWIFYGLLNLLLDLFLEMIIIIIFVRIITLINVYWSKNNFWMYIIRFCGATSFLAQIIMDNFEGIDIL